MKVSRSSLAAIALVGVLVLTVVAALSVIGSPTDERMRRLDERRVAELARIANAVDVFWMRHERLPASLAEARQDQGNTFALNDPATATPYEYAVDARRFQVCAQFDTESRDSAPMPDAGFWTHRAGRVCFQREARKAQ